MVDQKDFEESQYSKSSDRENDNESFPIIDTFLDELTSEKSITISIGNKILIYRKNLQTKPIILIPASESEKDRNELAKLYPQIKYMPTKMLDARMYNLLLLMQRKRDLRFFQDHSTPQNRVQRLARFMVRLSTPIIFLNHNHAVVLAFPEKNSSRQVITDEIIERKDFNEYSETQDAFLSQEEFLAYRNNLKRKLFSKVEWKRIELNELLSHLECDLLSQILSTGDELMMLVSQNGAITFINPSSNDNTKKNEVLTTFAYIFEPNL